MKKLLIIETEHVGHYLTGYIKYILRALDKKKIKIYILTSKETLKNGKGALKILKSEKVKFEKLLKLKKSFLPKLYDTAKEKVFK